MANYCAAGPVTRRPDRVRSCLLARLRGHRLEAAGFALHFRTLEGLAQVQEPERAGSEARGARGLGAVMPSFSLQIRTSKGSLIYRLDEGDIIEWMENGSSDLKRGRITALQSRDGTGHGRSKPIRIEPVDINNSATGGRERWISRWWRYPTGVSVEASTVPRPIRLRAYKTFELDRRRRK